MGLTGRAFQAPTRRITFRSLRINKPNAPNSCNCILVSLPNGGRAPVATCVGSSSGAQPARDDPPRMPSHCRSVAGYGVQDMVSFGPRAGNVRYVLWAFVNYLNARVHRAQVQDLNIFYVMSPTLYNAPPMAFPRPVINGFRNNCYQRLLELELAKEIRNFTFFSRFFGSILSVSALGLLSFGCFLSVTTLKTVRCSLIKLNRRYLKVK
ncbi:hypothetical protein PHJA_002094700 [Phtheirospermum japonicum]|uniref:Uncharacterized protein n=1 Tax=Phtheirospermum japonicum TaxID=374723 RepID=A0A830CJM0_9LAMI|nr:hypothetical protein PHJA_002094700 [Phtheirospermum japonicum]